jgi:hypothetical protein
MVALFFVFAFAAPDSFESVQPLLTARCASCHGGKSKQGGLSVETRDDLLTGGKTGAAIVPGNAVDSLLMALVMSGKMPMGGKALDSSEVAALRRWIEAGALKQGEQVLTRPVAEREILAPVLGAKCFVCHGRREQRAGLDLRTRASMLKGGKSGPAIVPGNPDASLLVQRIAAQQMPPPALQEQYCVRTVDSGELEKIRQWIAQGARPDDERPLVVDPRQDPLVNAAAREFWSFKPPVRPAVPAIAGARTPIDAFLLRALTARKLTYSAEAGKLALMRRAYYDLIGLPPTPEEVRTYAADARPDAYERLVDRLLASPRYGERWARYWLDAAGYQDSEGGVSSDAVRPTSWRYRDYVIRAFNADRPYNEFLKEQLAGDEMFDYRASKPYTPRQADLLAATGFLRLAPDSTYSTEQNFLPERFDAVAAEVEILGTAVMGLSLGCARCHDHKYDPLPQRDYYRVNAVFQTALDPYDWRIPNMECGGVGAKCEEKNLRFLPDLESQESKEVLAFNAPLERQVAEIEQQIEEAAMPYRQKAGKPSATVEELVKQFDDLKKQVGDLRKTLGQVRGKIKPTPGFRALFDMGGEPTPVRILLRGDPNNPGPLVDPGPPSVLSALLPPYVVEKPAHDTSGRRLAFAKWLTEPNHPLTARVMVNRIWQQHFGTGIVKSAGNFGKMGTPPSNPELLDWLATEFVSSGWSVKKLHRLIMTSGVYRQSSAVADPAVDPANVLLSRFPLRRLDAEAVRDAILKMAGRLDETEFGPPAPIEVKPDGAVLPKAGKSGYRRSIYVLQRRSTPVSLLDAFDAPFMSPNCIRRGESIVSSQALQLMNGEQIRESARYLAGRVLDAAEAAPDQVERLYLTVLSRPPTAAESAAALTTLTAMTAQWKAHYTANPSPEPVAWKAAHMGLSTLAHTLLNSAEFLYVD